MSPPRPLRNHSVAKAQAGVWCPEMTDAIPVLNLVARVGDGPRRVEG